MRPLSYSQISRYLTCPLWYKLQYIDKLQPKERYYLSFGDVIHQCAEYFFKVAAPPPPTLEKLQQFYESNWISDGYETPDQEQQYKEYGKQILAEFWELHFNNFRMPLAVEYQFLVNVEGVPLSGKIDRIDKLENGVAIIDYKTNKDLFTSEHLKQDLQLTLYQLAVEMLFKLPVKQMTLYHLRSNIPCTCDGRNQNILEEARNIILKVAEGISSEIFPAAENRFCDYCDFPQYCPYHKHKFASGEAERPQPKKILQGKTANEVVELYAALQARKKDLEIQLDELKEMICDYCTCRGFKRLYGQEHTITYRMVERAGFMEEKVKVLLEPAGLWTRVLKFDPGLLKTLLEANDLKPDLRKKLEALKQITSSFPMLSVKKS